MILHSKPAPFSGRGTVFVGEIRNPKPEKEEEKKEFIKEEEFKV